MSGDRVVISSRAAGKLDTQQRAKLTALKEGKKVFQLEPDGWFVLVMAKDGRISRRAIDPPPPGFKSIDEIFRYFEMSTIRAEIEERLAREGIVL